jgi:hypothetical protein
MEKFSRLSPTRKLRFAILRSRWNELDGRLYNTFPLTVLREEYRAVFGSSEVSNQRKPSVYGFTFP